MNHLTKGNTSSNDEPMRRVAFSNLYFSYTLKNTNNYLFNITFFSSGYVCTIHNWIIENVLIFFVPPCI